MGYNGTPYDPTNPDPFSLAYGLIWQMLLANPRFCLYVPIGNQIRLDGLGTADTPPNRDPFKREPTPGASFPEVAVMPAGGPFDFAFDSDHNAGTMIWQVRISTGDERVVPLLYPVKWEVLCALNDTVTGYPTAILEAIWNGVQGIYYAVRLSSFNETIESDRKVLGWVAVVQLSIDFAVPKALMQVSHGT